MAKFLGIHRMGGPITVEQMNQTWSAYKETAIKRGLKPIRVSFNTSEGIAICETEANSKKEVEETHKELNKMPEEIIEVQTFQS